MKRACGRIGIGRAGIETLFEGTARRVLAL
jgi:hypothetical protein